MSSLFTEKEPQTLGDWAHLAIQKHAHQIFKNEANVVKDKDPEALHQMRVGMRRLRSAVVAFDVALELPKSLRSPQVGKVARVLGKLRDIDVLKISLLDTYLQLLPDSEQELLKKVIEDLEEERKTALFDVKSILRKDIYGKIKKDLPQWLKKPKYTDLGKINIQEVFPYLLLPIISELFLHPGWWMRIESSSDDRQALEKLLAEKGSTLHDLRKQVKRSRYQMELFADLYGDRYQSYIADFKEIQDILGEIQDSLVLADFLETVVDIDIQKQMPTFLVQLQQSRAKLWQDWSKFQEKYLNLETRKSLHLEVLS
jgi:CHAD domain-containing protein